MHYFCYNKAFGKYYKNFDFEKMNLMFDFNPQHRVALNDFVSIYQNKNWENDFFFFHGR